MIASLRATATRAFDMPIRLARRMPQAFRLHHVVVLVSKTVAAVTKALRTDGSPRGCVKTEFCGIVLVVESEMYREALYPWARPQSIHFIS